MKRAIIIVMDSVGMGELPDAEKYKDKGSNTLGNISRSIEGFSLPHLQKLGLGNIDGMSGFTKDPNPSGSFARMAEVSAGKDTTTGHWELSGIILKKPFPVYENGFPPDIIENFENITGRKTLGNIAASGTEIINSLGDEHVRTGYPIVYTSADSVFQIAAHEDIIPPDELYDMCRKARNLLNGEHAVGRVIARPFTGKSGSYTRTSRRHDFSLEPIEATMLDFAANKGLYVKAVGKINDIFAGKGITHSVHTTCNMEGVVKTVEFMKESFSGIIFTNLVDFDMLYGHRNNVKGYADALIEFDNRIPDILDNMDDNDILFITADHGCDPTTPSTDHSREYVPLLVYGKRLLNGINLGTRKTFSDLAATVEDYLETERSANGESFLDKILPKTL